MNCWGNAYQAEGTASAKTPSRGLLGVLEELQDPVSSEKVCREERGGR